MIGDNIKLKKNILIRPNTKQIIPITGVAFVTFTLIFSTVFLIKSISNYKLMKKLKLLDLFYFTPFIEIFHLILIQFLYMYSTIRGKKSW